MPFIVTAVGLRTRFLGGLAAADKVNSKQAQPSIDPTTRNAVCDQPRRRHVGIDRLHLGIATIQILSTLHGLAPLDEAVEWIIMFA